MNAEGYRAACIVKARSLDVKLAEKVNVDGTTETWLKPPDDMPYVGSLWVKPTRVKRAWTQTYDLLCEMEHAQVKRQAPEAKWVTLV